MGEVKQREKPCPRHKEGVPPGRASSDGNESSKSDLLPGEADVYQALGRVWGRRHKDRAPETGNGARSIGPFTLMSITQRRAGFPSPQHQQERGDICPQDQAGQGNSSHQVK